MPRQTILTPTSAILFSTLAKTFKGITEAVARFFWATAQIVISERFKEEGFGKTFENQQGLFVELAKKENNPGTWTQSSIKGYTTTAVNLINAGVEYDRFEAVLMKIHVGGASSLVKKISNSDSPTRDADLEQVLSEAETAETGAKFKEAIKETKENYIPKPEKKEKKPELADQLTAYSDLPDELKVQVQRSMVSEFIARISGLVSIDQNDADLIADLSLLTESEFAVIPSDTTTSTENPETEIEVLEVTE